MSGSDRVTLPLLVAISHRWWTCAVLVLISAGSVTAAPPPPSAAHPLNPFSFAPIPSPLPSANGALARQLSNLLKGFRPVQKAEVLISGHDDQSDLAVQVVLRPRPGQPLDPQLLQSAVPLVLGAVPGLDPRRLNIVSSDGAPLVLAGQVQATPASSDPPLLPWLPPLLVLVVALAAATWWVARVRRPTIPEPLNDLVTRHGGRLAVLLRDERPEISGLLLSRADSRAARRLQRALRAEGVMARLPARPPQARAAQAVVQALRERLG